MTYYNQQNVFDYIIKSLESTKDRGEPDSVLIACYSDSEYARNVMAKRYYKIIAKLTLTAYNIGRSRGQKDWLDLDDLHTEAIAGFNSAIKNYSPNSQNEAKFSTYAYRCIYGYLINMVKGETIRKQHECSYDNMELKIKGFGFAAGDLPDSTSSSEAIYSNNDIFSEVCAKENVHIISSMIEELHGQLKYVVKSYYQEEQTLDQIAQTMDCSKEHVRQLRNKAHLVLRDKFRQAYGTTRFSELVENGELLVV